MRIPALVCVVCFTLATIACDGSDPASPALKTGAVAVYVHWGDQGLAGKQVEVLELDRASITNQDGVATFRVPAGEYTVRVYEINRGGPVLHYFDTKVTVASRGTTTVDVVDCLPCV